MPNKSAGSGEIAAATITRRALLGTGALALGLGAGGVLAAGKAASGLATAWRKAFKIGVAVSNETLDGQVSRDLELIAREFNSVTGENAMKWGVIRPDGVNWQWQRADRLVDFATQHDMYVLGHTLVWHSQIPRTVFNDPNGNPLTRAALLARMEEHIATLVGRYRGRVRAWDVVNEAVDEGNGWRHSPWHDIIGDDFMEQAFRFARKADPAARLLYNDYNTHNPRKVAFLTELFRGYRDRGVPIDGVGLQSHIGLNYPDLEEFERSIAAFEALGLEVHVTELDIDVLPNPNEKSAEISNRFEYSRENDPWPNGLPDEVQKQLADRYEQFFRMLLRHRNSVKRVTFWGLHDGVSWKNGFPIRGRTNYPLLFDRSMRPKPAYDRLMQLAKQI
jgi:endo-1,4-beta-xylanase